MDNSTPVSALAGGVLIGLASVWLLAANGRIAGVSGILHGIFAQPPGDRTWRALFVIGLVAAGFVFVGAMIAGGVLARYSTTRRMSQRGVPDTM